MAYTLSAEQQKYVRNNSKRLSPDTIAKDLYMPRSVVMNYIINEGLSMKRERKPRIAGVKQDWVNQVFRGGK